MQQTDRCFHCALPIPAGTRFEVEVDGGSMRVCCPGCKAVAELIIASGMERYYALREAPLPGAGRPEADSDEWRVFDRPDMQDAFTSRENGAAVANVHVAGMYCAACSWLIETTLSASGGVDDVSVNPITHRVRVEFAPDEIGLGDVLTTLADLGYKPQPLAPGSDARPELLEQRTALKRLLVASLGMMQVMMFAIGLYAGEFQGIDAAMQKFLRLVSFIVTTPVVFYSARPFFANAVRGLKSRHPGMDLPVSIAIGSAYAASVYSMLTDGEAVWFDSVTMFVFFLTLARFLEMRARHRSVDRAAATSRLLPNTVIRVVDGVRERIPVSRLVRGDRVAVAPGDAIPADGTVANGASSVDEALLTGEATPRRKAVGDRVVAGSVNLDGAIEVEVAATGVDTTLGAIGRLSERARHARPGYVRLADRVAGYVVVATLLVAALVAAGWSLLDPSRAFVITLSVLVVTCPCALALATPAAFAAAGGRLAELRLLVTNGNAIETLSRTTHVIFDKTGTLTLGRPEIRRIEILDPSTDEATCRAVAAALEADSTHPLASAFRPGGPALDTSNVRAVAGSGVAGTVAGEDWRLGRREFAAPDAGEADTEGTAIWLGRAGRGIARFELEDALRPDAVDTIAALKSAGIGVSIVSGDGRTPVDRAAGRLGVDEAHADCMPEDKLACIRKRQQQGETVLMVGDGINDAPVLAGADVSIAPAHAAELAQTSADVIMLGASLSPLLTALGTSRRTMRIVRQNLGWAIVYNACALPLAVAGFVPPWLAAIGMSSSSLVVVLNALRLGRTQPETV